MQEVGGLEQQVDLLSRLEDLLQMKSLFGLPVQKEAQREIFSLLFQPSAELASHLIGIHSLLAICLSARRDPCRRIASEDPNERVEPDELAQRGANIGLLGITLDIGDEQILPRALP